MQPKPTGPLDGVRVLDLSSVVMGPLATQILGDLGADVITVEDPRGTLSRVMTAGPVPTLSGLALNLLRNKRNVVLDLKDPEGRREALAIAATVDIVVTNLRPGTLARLGMTYEDVRAVCEDVVYCQAQGYPSDSPAADAPAYDDVIQAGSGIPDTFRRMGGVPVLVPTLVADKVSGLTIAYAVLAALFERERTGRGQRIEVPMIDVMTAFTLVEHAGPATTVPPLGPPGYARILNRSAGRNAPGTGGSTCSPTPGRTTRTCSRRRAGTTWSTTSGSGHPGRGSSTPTACTQGGRGAGRPHHGGVARVLCRQGHPGVARSHARGVGGGAPRGRAPAGGPIQGHPPAGALRQPPGPDHPPPRRSQREHTRRCGPGRRVGRPPPAREHRPTRHGRTRLRPGHGAQPGARRPDHRRGGPMTPTTTGATFGDVTVTLGDRHVAEVEMHRPPANYFDAALLASVVEAVDWADTHGGRAVVLCSEGRHFCAGLDFGSTDRPDPDTLATLYATATRLVDGPMPMVAAVQGAAVGGGLGLALAADFRVAAPAVASRPTSPDSGSTRVSASR